MSHHLGVALASNNAQPLLPCAAVFAKRLEISLARLKPSSKDE